MKENNKPSAAVVLEKLIRKVIREELQHLRTEIKQELISEMTHSTQRMPKDEPFTKQVTPKFSSNDLINSLLGETYERTGGNESVPTEGRLYRERPIEYQSPNNGLSLTEAVPIYDPSDGTGDGMGNGGLRVSNAAAVIKSSPGLTRALTRDYSDLVKAWKKVK